MQGQVYRYRNWLIVVAGLAFSVFGILSLGWAIFTYASGKQISFYIGDQEVRPMPAWAYAIPFGLPLLCVFTGLLLLAHALLSKVIVDEAGITGYGLRGKPTFAARWEEVSSIDLRSVGESEELKICAGSRTLRISSGIGDWKELVETVRMCSPVQPIRRP